LVQTRFASFLRNPREVFWSGSDVAQFQDTDRLYKSTVVIEALSQIFRVAVGTITAVVDAAPHPNALNLRLLQRCADRSADRSNVAGFAA
jgi:hypothetical protein